MSESEEPKPAPKTKAKAKKKSKSKSVSFGPRRAEGEPILGITASLESPWTAAAGSDAKLLLTLNNRGGPTHGIYVELGGDATAGGLVTGLAVSVGDDDPIELTGQGQTFRAELADVSLDAGYADPKDAKIAKGHPSVQLVAHVRGEKAGSAFMTIRVGVLGSSGATGSALQGRSFVVSEA